ncbi:hypothetical protein PVAP13_3NG273100 [Panicum virgatum]|uniref:Cationic amino acid transporter C-terminal domain-containing protein n=1 Tax=Panicum virgatum TaxID=38727 RepID=A0A8T0UE30_PANVG|nr:hypothetical protein PVAP13_3NG273100 [Panicum virgatum]
MGFEGAAGAMGGGVRALMRRKQVDSERARPAGSSNELRKELSVAQLIAIGVGSTIGAGVYVLVGTVAREHSGPALTLSFLIAGIAAALSAFCYAELASRCPSAGSAYHYSYICVGEGVAWLIGWALILEYTIGGSAVARGISPNLALFFGGADNLPLGIATALSICCSLYMLVSVVIVGLVPYFAMDPDTPISSAFARHGVHWAMYLVTTGAVLALCSTLMGSILPQPRILMAMARDGLLPSFFSDVHKTTQVPVKSTIVTGICAASLAFFMDVSQLAGMVSVGTLLAFTIVAVSILILRYVPPDEVPLPSSLQASFRLSHENDEEKLRDTLGDEDHEEGASEISDIVVESIKDPLIEKQLYASKLDETKRRKTAACSIASVCIGVLVLTTSASATFLPFLVRCFVCAFGGLLLLTGLGVLCWIDQDDGRHSFGHSGGFICPFVPLLPVMCILINTYLLINLGGGTWMRVGVWLVMGVFVYIFYGRTHSSLTDVVYVPVAEANEIYGSSSASGFVA